MQITLTWQSVVTAAGILGAIMAIIAYLRKLFGWFERQEAQEAAIRAIRTEQQLLTYGVLSCLKGLQEQGCNGPVTDAINRIEKHINQEAHR